MLHFLATVALLLFISERLSRYISAWRLRRAIRRDLAAIEAHEARKEHLLSTSPMARVCEPQPGLTPPPPPPPEPPRYELVPWAPPADRWVHPAILATGAVCLILMMCAVVVG